MKRHTLLLIFVILFINVSIAQIPNNGFENWSNMGAYENPLQWGTINNVTAAFSIYTAQKGTPGNPGTAYLKLTSKTIPGGGVANGIAVSGKLDTISMKPISGFAYNVRSQNFTGKWQYMVYGGSFGSVAVTLTKWNSVSGERDTIAIANRTLTGMAMGWASFSIPFVYQGGDNPDSCIIFLKASGAVPSNLDYLWVDDLGFSGTEAGIENHKANPENVSVYPNPCEDHFVVELNLKSAQKTIIKMFDMDGKLVLLKNMGMMQGPFRQIVDIYGIPKGSYVVNIITGNENNVKKIVVQ
jgi:hypothetical protein